MFFLINPYVLYSQYQLVTKQPLDREEQKFYVIPFRTTDQRGVSGVRTLTVEVGDQNDSPMYDGNSQITVYNYKVPENILV